MGVPASPAPLVGSIIIKFLFLWAMVALTMWLSCGLSGCLWGWYIEPEWLVG